MTPPLVPPTPFERIAWIDVLRGIAIILMIPANLAPYFGEPHPMWFRVLGSFAAPVFVMLSAGMVVLRSDNHDATYYVRRGAAVILFGVMLDAVLWRIFPFTSFDVLYVIGIALPLMYATRKFATREFVYLGLICFAAAYALQHYFGYYAEVLEIYFDDAAWPGIPRLLRSLAIDGWFPLFPWLGYAFLGAAFFRVVFASPSMRIPRSTTLAGLVLGAAGFAALFLPVAGLENIPNGDIIESRGGYSEIFYPVTYGYMAASLGVVVLFAWLSEQVPAGAVRRTLTLFGRYSMLVYLLHQSLGALVLAPIIAYSGAEVIDSGPLFFAAVFIVTAVILFACLLVERSKRRYRPKALLLQLLLGK